MEIYLPIAEQSMNVFILLGLGGAAGLLSGMFGVGGGFLATPLLIFVGIPPAVAVASQANQVVSNSISSLQVHWRRGNVDLRMGLVLLLGGMIGSSAGVSLFTYLKNIGQIDFVIAVLYVVMLSTIGVLMLFESARTYIRRRRNPEAPRGKLHTHYLVHRLPLKLRFYKSKLYISALLPIGIGFAIGVLSAILGVGGGFVLVPAMIYILGMPTAVVIGTSNFQILFVAVNVTFLQAATNGTVDVVLALLLILGGVVGAPIGARLAARLPGVVLRGLMSVLILAVAVELLTELLRTPASPFSLGAREVLP
ncbi:MAG TPA: sulfite exporter TauE/SafE family protein [Reyranella sp.]|nr:sulfite exporter TauE/SafE family protein [Reyranella sp.]